MSAHDDRCQSILNRIKEVAGEHAESFVFIAEITDEEDEGTTTVMTWDGGFNTARGLIARAEERLRQKMIQTDFPDDPTPGDDWKAEV